MDSGTSDSYCPVCSSKLAGKDEGDLTEIKKMLIHLGNEMAEVKHDVSGIQRAVRPITWGHYLKVSRDMGLTAASLLFLILGVWWMALR